MWDGKLQGYNLMPDDKGFLFNIATGYELGQSIRVKQSNMGIVCN